MVSLKTRPPELVSLTNLSLFGLKEKYKSPMIPIKTTETIAPMAGRLNLDFVFSFGYQVSLLAIIYYF